MGISHPLDTVKVRLQTAERGKFNGAFDCLVKTLRLEGARGLYKGVLPPLLATGIISALFFAAYGQAMAFLTGGESENDIILSTTGDSQQQEQQQQQQEQQQQKKKTLLNCLLSGGYAGFAISLLVSPVELIKCQQQANYDAVNPNASAKLPNRPSSPSFVRVVTGLVRDRLIFRGLGATLAREIPGSAIYFSTYEMASEYKREQHYQHRTADTHRLTSLELMATGATAGCFYWTAIFPIDMIKSKIQTTKIGGIKFHARIIYKEYGMKGFYMGFSPTIMRNFVENIPTFLVYETARDYLLKLGIR